MKIRRRRRRSVPGLNMASMPDLIFTVLFFFMIVTHMRTETVRMELDVPDGRELTKAKNRRAIVNLYIGRDSHGMTRIQVGEHTVPLEKVGAAVMDARDRMGGDDAASCVVNIRADRHTPMGAVTDVKQELRKVGALNIRYSATEMDRK